MPRPGALRFGALLESTGGLDLPRIGRTARTLEEGGFAAILLADRGRRLTASPSAGGADRFEPFTLLSALSSVTERIGLVVTVGAIDDEPYTVSRKLASLDHLSHGRAGWGVAPLEGADAARAAELVDVVTGLWDGIDDDAMIRDRASGIYLDLAKRRALDHRGEHFAVAGPLNIARPPQGRPVMFQAGGTEPDQTLAARYGEVILTAPSTLEQAAEYRAALDAQLAAAGRDPGEVRVWPLLRPAVEDADAAGAVADRLTEWHASGAVDGFTVAFPSPPDRADRFVGEVLPLLQERGVLLPPEPGTLRDQLGLARPGGAAA